MSPKELRVGNYVYWNGKQIMLDEDHLAMIFDSQLYDEYSAIVLTDEWLLKFGFEDWGKDGYDYTRFVLHNVIDGTSDFEILVAEDVRTMVRISRGRDIKAACGHLKGSLK